ncbi:MAG: DUF4252 domain-containing protein, partial [Bacteroidales bacterium]|nr:DUF4252 domain-containing protein [Bacteroidales bacterium]
VREKIHDEASRFVKSKKYELLMEAKDNGEAMNMYTIGNDKIINGFVFLAQDGEETSFICFDGNIDRKQFEDTVSSLTK